MCRNNSGGSDSPGQESDDSELTEEEQEQGDQEEQEEEDGEGEVPDMEEQDWMSACCSEEAVSFFSALATSVGGGEEKLETAATPPSPYTPDLVYSAPPPCSPAPLQPQVYHQVASSSAS